MKLMRRITFFLALLPVMAWGDEGSPPGIDSITIEAVEIQPSVRELAEKQGKTTELLRVGNSLEQQLTTALSATRAFQLIAAGPKTERALEQNAAEDADDSEAMEVAQPAEAQGAKYRFLPQIDGFEDRSIITDHPAINRSSLNRTVFLSALVRIVETTTGKILPDAPAIQLTKTEQIEHARLGQVAGSDQIIVAIAREMAQQLSRDAAALLSPAKVLTVTGKQLLINRGTEAGFEKGDLIEIFATRKVKDDDTGEMYNDETPVGQAIITRLDKKQSFATISGDDTGIVKGAIVRRAKSAATRRSEAEEQPPDPTIPDFNGSDKSGPTSGSGEKPFKWK